MRSRRVPSLLQACSCLPACLLLPVQAASGLPAPHEVGVCHRLCPVLFPDFVCLFGFARLLVSAPSRLRVSSCLSRPAPACSTRSRCLSQVMPCVFFQLRVTFRGRGRGRARARARVVPRVSFRGRAPGGAPAPPAPTQIQCGGRFPRPPLYPINGPNVTACRTRSPKLRCLPTPSDAVACSTGS